VDGIPETGGGVVLTLHFDACPTPRIRALRIARIAMEAQKEIDTRGLNCPLPILKAKKALADMASGEILKVLATDPGSVRDFQAFARQTGNELVEQTTEAHEFIHFLRRR
jgi:TusA-related sulfurtransferase